jgi:polyisoprenoid-binding protein YceI
MMLRFMFAFFLIFAGTVSAFAATDNYVLDPAHSSIEFRIRHLVGRVTGFFGEFSGNIQFDEENHSASSIDAQINAASINTRIKDRDDHLKSGDFFDVENFPDGSFISKRIDSDSSTIMGDLTLHGVTKEVVLDYTYHGKAQDPWGKTRIGASVTGKIDRRDFGINYDPTGVTIGHSVEIRLEIEAILEA